MSIIDSQESYKPIEEPITGNGDTLNNLQKLTMGSGANRLEANIKDGFWMGADTFLTAPFSVDFLGALLASSVTIKTSGGTVLIDSDSSTQDYIELINSKLNTSSKEILSDFTFTTSDYAGAFKTGDIEWSTSTGLPTSGTGGVFNAKGLIFAKNGTPTITLDGVTGDATFAGTVAGASGTFGTVTAGTFTGCTFQSATTGYRTKLSADGLEFLNNTTVKGSIRADTGDTIVYDSVDNHAFFGQSDALLVTFNEDGITLPSSKSIFFSGGVEIRDEGSNLYISEATECGGNIYPRLENSYDCGASDKRWRKGYFEDIQVDDLFLNTSMTGAGYINIDGDVDCDDVTCDQMVCDRITQNGYTGVSGEFYDRDSNKIRVIRGLIVDLDY